MANRLYSVKQILEPLAIAATVLQAPNTRLYTVLLTLGNLFRIFSQSNANPEVVAKLLGSLEKRWDAADQDVFILSLVLNPYIRNACFAPGHPELSRSGLCAMAKRVCERTFDTQCNSDFTGAFMDYLHGREEFSAERMHLDHFEQIAENEVSLSLNCL